MAKPRFEHSFSRAITVMLVAVILGAMFSAFKQLESFPNWIIHLVVLGSITGTIAMVRDIQYWNHEYALGWIIGLPIGIFFMVKSGVISFIDILVYGGVTVAGFYIKYLAD